MRQLFAGRGYGDLFPRAFLNTIWYVEADSSYHIYYKNPWISSTYVALRTLTGQGTVHLQTGDVFSAEPNTLLILQSKTLLSYGTAENNWQFYWYEFDMPQLESALLNRVFFLTLSAHEQVALERSFFSMRSGTVQACSVAEALFNYLLADWQSQVLHTGESTRKLLQLLEKGRSTHMPIPVLAREAGMCERSFRNAVYAATGLSPKAYMLKSEMDAAMELLRTTRMRVTDISTRFNYSSPLYFSRVFKKHFGFSPQHIRDMFTLQTHNEKGSGE